MPTLGQYYFAPEGTPFFPAEHYYGSRIWTTEERVWDGRVALGETDGNAHIYTRGQPPVNLPLARIVGNLDCIINGTCSSSQRPPLSVIGCLTGTDTLYVYFFEASGAFKSLNGREAPLEFLLFDPHSEWATPLPFPTDPILGDYAGLLYCGFGFGMRLRLFMFPFGVGGMEVGTIDIDAPLTHRLLFDFISPNPAFPGGFKAAVTRIPASAIPPLLEGLPLGCFATSSPIDVLSRGNMASFANILDLTYTDINDAAAALTNLLPGMTTAAIPNDATVIPGTVIGQRSDQTVMVISGTSNLAQLVGQLGSGAVGIMDYGIFTTANIWWDAATILLNRLNATGFNTALPLTIVGHSYGGAIGSIMAARIKAANPQMRIQLLTMGTPKAGDARLSVALSQVTRVHLANDGDFVCDIPPTLPAILGLIVGPPAAEFIRWGAVAPLGKRWVLFDDGTLSETDAAVYSIVDLVGAALDIIAGTPIDVTIAHSAATYRDRLLIQL